MVGYKKNELIKGLVNPLSDGKVRMPAVHNRKLGFLTKDQAAKLLHRLKTENGHSYQLTVLLLYTGARFSEVAGLRWSDINFGDELIYYKPSKDGNARHVKMTPSVLSIINDLDENRINELVIPTKFGNQYEKMPKLFQRVVDELNPGNKTAGKNRITTHSLRHTHASWLAQAGTDLLIIKENLGHKRLDTTMIYSHMIISTRHEATLALES